MVRVPHVDLQRCEAQQSGGGPEVSIADLEEIGVGTLGPQHRDDHQLLPMSGLEPVFQHRSVDFGQDIGADLDDTIRTNTKDVLIVSRMVNLAHRETIADDWNPFLKAVGDDVRSVQQLAMPQ